MKRVVMLVDQKRRDLPGAALVRHYLEKLGIECILEPVQAWGAAIGYHKPDMLVISNLFNDSFVEYSRRLHGVGVKVGVLPNEGAVFDEQYQHWRSFGEFKDAYVDSYFAWNQLQADMVRENLRATNPDIECEVTGCPRFDFNFPPLRVQRMDGRPTALLCTKFVLAHYYLLDRKQAADWLGPLSQSIEALSDWWGAVENDYHDRERYIDVLDTIVAETDIRLIIRPHPDETPDIYEEWHGRLGPEDKARIQVEPTRHIDELISECDVLVSVDTCTTSVEAWMGGTPAMELSFSRLPPFYFEEVSRFNPQFTDWTAAAAEMQRVATGGAQDDSHWQGRREHLAHWYGSPAGDSAQKVAAAIAKCVSDASPDYTKLPYDYLRKGAKLAAMHRINKPYGWHPLTRIKAELFPKKYSNKAKVAQRAMTAAEAKMWKEKLDLLLGASEPIT